ncbi:MAG: thioredoxin domain-containing protein [Bacteroidota bacterium]|nr:thioredoxin domain-containing protein [Bacteroidota bacterium]
MRPILILVTAFLITSSVKAQTKAAIAVSDSLPPYQKNRTIPAFSIQTPDSSWFSKVNLQPKKPTLILYFSPDCGHCQIETEEVLSKMKELNKLQIVMVTSRPFEDMVKFADHYKINRFPSIKIGTDPSRMVTQFYTVKFTPFSALYDRKGQLVKVYEQGIDMPDLINLTK